MRKTDFRDLITTGDFRDLFVIHLGWNKCRSLSRLMPIMVEDVEYSFNTVAELEGFKVLVSEVDTLPKGSTLRKLDSKLISQARDYIAIYILRSNPQNHLWVVPLKNVDKRDLVSLEYKDASQSDFLYSKIGDIEFEPGETLTIVDVKEAVHKAFFVNSEKITKDFYSGFKKQHAAFAKFISGIDDQIETKYNSNKQWYASVMLNRLMFCYFIQKKGFLDNDTHYLRKKLNWCKAERGADRFFSTFYKGFLTVLFSGGLNAPEHDREFESQFGQIPYLNGGMFDRHKIERDYADIDIADDAFDNLFEFFDHWEWHLDTSITASGRDINPDVLGYIFEQYINDRAQMGAYYTKEDITEYIGRNTILPYIFDKVSQASQSMADMFAPKSWVWQTLQSSGNTYIFDAMKQGWTPDWRERIPDYIAIGLDTHAPDLLDRRAHWNDRTPEPYALPTEIWRETIERLQRVDDITAKISNGEITSINDFITYNLDIRQFASDLIKKSDSGAFVYNFYDALRTVTILDPTCGSGAFLFAAMNILEPLYYECIMRLDEFKSTPKVKAALDEIESKYRSNIHYFIYKSIILRNLYGVDLMPEAVEIAKLRLFLKMVAVVDVDLRVKNLGLDPLPDIDFNIRCGNTLVGYANESSIWADHQQDMFAQNDFENNIKIELDIVARTYRQFKHIQLTQPENIDVFKHAKKELNTRLAILNRKLNHHLHSATASGMPYLQWLASHHPFHWVAEFYQIINENGGFDVIIGNPPYVNGINNLPYQLNGFSAMTNGNLYGFCMERSVYLLNPKGAMGMIVPQSLVKMPTYANLRKLLQKNLCHYSIYTGDTHCGVMFEGVQQNVTICIRTLQGNSATTRQSTRFLKFFSPERVNIFKLLKYSDFIFENITGSNAEISVFDKAIKHSKIERFLTTKSENAVFYRNTSGAIYKPFFDSEPLFILNGKQVSTSTLSKLCFNSEIEQIKFLLLYNSNLFNLWWCSLSDGRHITPRELYSISLPDSLNSEKNELKELAQRLMGDYVSNSKMVSYNRKNGIAVYRQFAPRLSKSIIDEIDKVLARHYGFTEEELDFIINYDIKYRMGDELNNDSDE